MVLKLNNQTPFTCQDLPMQEKNGATILRIVLKAGFTLAADGQLEIAEEQPKIIMEDEYWGAPAASSIRCDSDITLFKPATDFLVNGQAWARSGRMVKQVDVRIFYQARLLKHLRVFGDRYWTRGLIDWGMTSPEYFESMPVIYERAYGGSDEEGSEPRNRVGTGYASHYDAKFEGTRVANVEFPDQLIQRPRSKPAPAGLGVISRDWQPRLAFAGTYDEAWLKERFPLLPEDYDMRFNQSAPQDQWIPRPRGGEEILIEGMSADGIFKVELPECEKSLVLRYRDKTETVTMDLDSVLVEPDEPRLTLTWRASADIHGDPFRLLEMIVGDAKP